MGIFNFFTEEIAIDLGTANTLIIHNDKVVVDSPSIVAIDQSTGKVIAVGRNASLMQGKTHENIKTIRPLKDGVIANFKASEFMINELIKNVPAIKKRIFPPALKVVVCIPSGITEVEKRAVYDSTQRVNARDVYLVHEPMAAAIGVGIDVQQPKGNIIIDIGGGTAEIAVIARRHSVRQIDKDSRRRAYERYIVLHAYPAQPLRRRTYGRDDKNTCRFGNRSSGQSA